MADVIGEEETLERPSVLAVIEVTIADHNALHREALALDLSHCLTMHEHPTPAPVSKDHRQLILIKNVEAHLCRQRPSCAEYPADHRSFESAGHTVARVHGEQGALAG